MDTILLGWEKMNLTYFVVASFSDNHREYVKVEAENMFQAFAEANHVLQQKGFNLELIKSLYTLPSFKRGYPIQVRREKWIEEE